ncbi:MAG TPA: GvpL/GvpF family gas vesicle protein [Gemmatimonadaceae bacterium]|nr:GvpL/GvpF family gas vesicle protein [Gemmatimonadaceae bacterium]
MSALQLFGVALLDTHAHEIVPPAPDTLVVAVRDLGAVVAAADYDAPAPADAALERYREVVDAVFVRGAVLPAPPGTVFRSRDLVVRWLELHYHTLADGLAFVDERCEARVHIARRGLNGDPDDLATTAAESVRALRRGAVAAVPLRADGRDERVVMRAAFLVERERWAAFRELVASEQQRHAGLEFRQTGPWPPYDFVRMQFGG